MLKDKYLFCKNHIYIYIYIYIHTHIWTEKNGSDKHSRRVLHALKLKQS